MSPEELIKQLSAQVVARVKENQDKKVDSVTDETVRNMVSEMLKEMKLIDDKERVSGEFQIDDKNLSPSDDPLSGVKVKIDEGLTQDVKMLLPASELRKYYQPTLADKLVEWQKINDDLLTLGVLLHGAHNKRMYRTTFAHELRQTKLYAQAMTRLKSDVELRKALYTTGTGEGVEWIPTGFSNQLLAKIALERKVEAIFPSINMPNNPYTVPVELSGSTGYYVPESTADDSTKIKASKPGTSNFTFNARKFAGRVVFSDEINEDAVIGILGHVQMSLANAIAEAKETAIINGDDSTTHQDSNVTDSYDARKAFKGLRYYALNNAGTAKKDAGNVNLTTTLLRGTRMLMGKHGVDPTKLYYIVSPVGYIELLNLSELLTLDKYGANATILKGEAGKFDGGTVIVSEFMWDNLNAAGVYDGTTTNRTGLLAVYAPGFWVGVRTGVTLASETNIQTDQLVLVAKTRIAFEDPYNALLAANVQSAYLYNVKTTL